MKYSPQVEIAKLNLPILLVSGKNDIQVPPKEAEMLLKANPKAKLVYFDHMTHVLKDGEANMISAQKVYQQTDMPLTEGIVEAVVKWIVDNG